MAYKYIGTVEDGDGRACQVRWDDVTGVIHVHVYHFPISEDPRWEWMTTRARADARRCRWYARRRRIVRCPPRRSVSAGAPPR
jgi:hypothetical protein